MTNMFLYIMQLSVRAVVIIPLIIIIRFLIRKQPKIYSYALWAVVFTGLLINIKLNVPQLPQAMSPVGSVTSSVNSRYTELLDEYVGQTSTYYSDTLEYYDAIDSGITPVYNGVGDSYVVTVKDHIAPPVTVAGSVMPMLAVVWATGVITAVFILLKNLVDFHSRLFTVNIIKENICIAEGISSPFVYGIIRPKIYIPSQMTEMPMEHIIIHEQTHIRRGDHIIKPLCLLITVLHWFNPLVWLAF
ncbi:MAG: hypothetical protein IKJ05_00935, partial [Oscillospiraceae bacterium]|nr:hypothetical protein [Oscillospiraceae bacterium]